MNRREQILSRNRHIHIQPIDVFFYKEGNSVGKGKSFQQIMLDQPDIYMEKGEH